MNLIEQKYLTSAHTSHIARSVYVFFLKPNFEQNQKCIDLVALVNYLNTESAYFKTSANFEIAGLILKELEQIGLVKRINPDLPWHDSEFTLPYYVQESLNAPDKAFAMTLSWKPGPNFKDACFLCGLEDPTYQSSELKAFTSYWCAHLEQRNQTAWERAFAQRLLKKRIAKVYIKKESAKDNEEIKSPDTDTKISQDNKTLEVSKDDQEKVLSELNSLFN